MDLTPASEDLDAVALDETLDAPPIVRFDERRMHVRAYNYWASLLGERTLPSIEDLNPADILDFGSHSVLLDFTAGVDDPAIAFLGSALAAQCDVSPQIARVSAIPARTLLSRLTDHYLQIIANAAPISFEAEFTNQRGVDILYRGIMMPFSTDDDTIDFVYGVINWKEVADAGLSQSLAAEVEASLQIPRHAAPAAPIWTGEDRRSSERRERAEPFDLSFDMIDEDEEDEDALDTIPPGDNAALADHLAAARDAANAAASSEGRTRQALYRAVGLAHGFALLARARPADYAELLDDAGIVPPKGRETSALAKLVFGADYDKTRLAEFARAIDHALDQGVEAGGLAGLLLSTRGGLKSYVAAARAQARGRSAPAPSTTLVRARTRLAARAPVTPEALAFDEAGLGVAVVRRAADGTLSFLGGLEAGDALLARVLSSVARKS